MVARVALLWRALDLTDVDAAWPALLAALEPLVGSTRTASGRLAAAYLLAFARAELGDGARPAPAPVPDLDPAALRTSLLVTGPVALKRAMALGRPLEQASRIALAGVAGASSRHTLDGGREVLTQTVAADKQARGWARVTSGAPCHFCALLAARGPVYRGEDTGGFRAHDGCGCAVEPVYRDDAAWPGRAREWSALYNQQASGTSDPLNAWRRTYTEGAQAAPDQPQEGT